MTPTLKLEGARELEEALLGMKAVTAKKIVMPILSNALQIVADAAKGYVRQKSGSLFRSIGVAFALTKRQRAQRVALADFEAYVGSGILDKKDGHGVRHSHLIEFGTSHSAPQPFMRPAWEGNLQNVFNKLAEGISAALAKIVKANGGKNG